jgi:hypothetical protein
MATIQFAEDPRSSGIRNNNTDTGGPAGGIYSLRSRSRLPSISSTSDLKNTPTNDEDPGLREEGDYKQRQVRRIT